MTLTLESLQTLYTIGTTSPSPSPKSNSVQQHTLDTLRPRRRRHGSQFSAANCRNRASCQMPTDYLNLLLRTLAFLQQLAPAPKLQLHRLIFLRTFQSSITAMSMVCEPFQPSVILLIMVSTQEKSEATTWRSTTAFLSSMKHRNCPTTTRALRSSNHH